MHVPQREGVVVSVGEQDRVGFTTVEVHLSDVAGRVAVAAVVVVPVFGHHQRRNPKGQHRHAQCQRRRAVLGEQLVQGHHSESDPNREDVKGSDKGVVALARLKRLVVGVHHNGQAGEQEQQRDDPRIALVALGLKPQPQQSQQQRQGVVVVAAPLLRHRIRQIRLRPKAHLVNEVDARHPVAVDQLVAVLVVVLASGKIPHEVAEPHLAHLVVHEVLEVLGKRDFFVGIGAKNPLVVLNVVGLVRPHAREEAHVALGVVRLGRLAVVDDLVLARGLAVEVGG